MDHYIIAYDIKDDHRRMRIFKLLKQYATHVQYSIFETYISKEDMVVLQYKLRQLMNAKEDSIFIYRQCQCCSKDVKRLGMPVLIYGEDDIIL